MMAKRAMKMIIYIVYKVNKEHVKMGIEKNNLKREPHGLGEERG